jgi:protein-S-isoprenylcysteine O-methyltransferase Ste14
VSLASGRVSELGRATLSSNPRTALASIARLRVPLGFASGLLVLWLADPTGASLAAGSVVASVGEALRVWAAGHLQKSREVTASGPYRWMAHPLYVGSAIMGAGLAFASNNLIVAVVIATYLVVTLVAAVRTEERSLRRMFGDAYDRYRRAGDVDAARRFSFAQAVANGEHRAVAGVAVAFGLLALKAAL